MRDRAGQFVRHQLAAALRALPPDDPFAAVLADAWPFASRTVGELHALAGMLRAKSQPECRANRGAVA